MKIARVSAVVSLLFYMLSLGAGTSAYDKRGMFMAYGPGNEPCADFDAIRGRRLKDLTPEQHRLVESTLEYWLSGFYTAWNYFSSDTFDITGERKYEVILEQVERYCERHPDKKLVDAAVVVGHALHSTRSREASSGK